MKEVNPSRTSEIPKFKVVGFLIAGLLSFGFAPILVRFATDVEPITLAAMRTIFAVVLLLPFWAGKRATVTELKKNGIRFYMLVLAGLCLGLHFTFWIASLHYTSVASASVLVTIHPVILIVAESIIFKKSFRGVVWAGVFVAFSGSVMLGIADQTHSADFPNALLGNTLAFTAAAIFVIYFLLGRKVRQHAEWIDYVFHVYLYAALTCAVLTFLWAGGMPLITTSSVIIGLALAIGPTILGHGSMNYAVKYISPTLLSTLILSEAVFAATVAYFLFDEIPGWLSFTAMLIIITGITITWTRRLTRKKIT
ncbi:MAG: DMT family transporter [Balneolaceae bacterium]|nr:DMT family transporter [Balneolaceae bacterium]